MNINLLILISFIIILIISILIITFLATLIIKFFALKNKDHKDLESSGIKTDKEMSKMFKKYNNDPYDQKKIENIAFNFYQKKDQNIVSSELFDAIEVSVINNTIGAMSKKDWIDIGCYPIENYSGIKTILTNIHSTDIRFKSKDQYLIINQFNINSGHFISARIERKNNQTTIIISDSGSNTNDYSQYNDQYYGKNFEYLNDNDERKAIQKYGYECGPFSIYNAHKDYFNELGINYKDVTDKKITYSLFNSRVHIICFLIYDTPSNLSIDECKRNSEALKELYKKTLTNLENHQNRTQENFNNEIKSFRQCLEEIVKNQKPQTNLSRSNSTETINQNYQALGCDA